MFWPVSLSLSFIALVKPPYIPTTTGNGRGNDTLMELADDDARSPLSPQFYLLKPLPLAPDRKQSTWLDRQLSITTAEVDSLPLMIGLCLYTNLTPKWASMESCYPILLGLSKSIFFFIPQEVLLPLTQSSGPRNSDSIIMLSPSIHYSRSTFLGTCLSYWATHKVGEQMRAAALFVWVCGLFL